MPIWKERRIKMPLPQTKFGLISDFTEFYQTNEQSDLQALIYVTGQPNEISHLNFQDVLLNESPFVKVSKRVVT